MMWCGARPVAGADGTLGQPAYVAEVFCVALLVQGHWLTGENPLHRTAQLSADMVARRYRSYDARRVDNAHQFPKVYGCGAPTGRSH